MFPSIEGLIAEHAQLQLDLAESSLHTDPARAKKLNRRYAELNAIVTTHEQLVASSDDLAAAKELAKPTTLCSLTKFRHSKHQLPNSRRNSDAC
jgi:peptide chain release factor 1